MHRNYSKYIFFWELTPRRGDSWIWKRLCDLRRVARPFLVCEVGSGITASFCFDNWTELGPLIHLTGERGPFVSGLAKEVTVADALINGEWWLTASRSRNAIISLLTFLEDYSLEVFSLISLFLAYHKTNFRLVLL